MPGGGEGEAWGGGGGEEEDEVFYEPAPPDNKLDAAAVRADKYVLIHIITSPAPA